MADPSKYNSRIKRSSSSKALIRKPTFVRHPTTLHFSLSDHPNSPSPPATSPQAAPPRAVSVPIMKVKTPSQSTPTGKSFPFAAADIVDGVDEPDPFEEVEACESYVTALALVHLRLDCKQKFPTLTLWAGTVSGFVAAYGVSVLKDRGASPRKIELLPTSLVIELKSPVVNMHFLNEWGDKQVVPYQPTPGSCPQGQRKARNQDTASQKPTNYAIISDETKVRSFSFPGLATVSKCSPAMDGSIILKSEYFTCNDLPCLLILTSCKHILIYSLPGLKPIHRVPYAPLGDSRVMHTFRASGDGQALFMTSPSEVQRICLTKADRLNLPKCLPDVYTRIEDPQPASKGFLSDLFGSGRNPFDADAFFGGRAGLALVKHKRDGREHEPVRMKGGRHMDGRRPEGGAGGGGVGDRMQRNRQALDERRKKLSNIEERSAQMADEASDFARSAQRLAEKYK